MMNKSLLIVLQLTVYAHGFVPTLNQCHGHGYIRKTMCISASRTNGLRMRPKTLLNMSMDGGELTTALARLDRQWEITSRSSKRPTGGRPGWTKLILDPQNDNDNDDNSANEDALSQTIPTIPSQEEFVYLLEPPATPSIVILFLGGAGLGQFPHIAYSELLSRISTRLNAAIIAAPYPLSLDHFDLSKKAGESLRRAVVQCEERGAYSPFLPKFYLGHSLGGKLLGIQFAASGVRDVEGIGFMSYNNFGFKDTISMVKEFADNFSKDGSSRSTGDAAAGQGFDGALFDQILNFAGDAAGMMGFEFNPNPETMDRIVEMKFNQDMQRKTRLFVFEDDELDSSEGFLNACERASTSGPAISRLKGSHLSPVYVKLGLDDLEIAEEVKPFVNEASGGFQSASFGDEDCMNGAVNEVCDWIMGKAPNDPALLTAKSTAKELEEN